MKVDACMQREECTISIAEDECEDIGERLLISMKVFSFPIEYVFS